MLLDPLVIIKTGVKKCIGVISNIVSDTTGMQSFEKLQASYLDLELILSFLIDDTFYLLIIEPVWAEQLFQFVVAKGLEGAPVKLIYARVWLV